MSTVLDVARLAGVSTATVSRVKNSPDSVRQKTREKVLLAMEKCNYKYNALARGFVTKKSNTIGLITPTISNSVFAESTLGVQEYADQKNIRVILGNSYYKYSQEVNLVKALRESQVDGLIITSTTTKARLLNLSLMRKFCSKITFAHGAIQGARELRLTLPGDLSIVGFDNVQTASYMVPALTTIHQPAYEMGRRAAEILLQLTENQSKPTQDMMDTALVIRESTTPCPI